MLQPCEQGLTKMLIAFVIISVLALLTIINLYPWMKSVIGEKRIFRSLVKEAEALPDDVESFSKDEALHALRILERMWALPTIVPIEVPSVQFLIEQISDLERIAQS